MKLEDVPQDLKYFEGTVIRDIDYAVDSDGRYKAVQSDGWAPKNWKLPCKPLMRSVRRYSKK